MRINQEDAIKAFDIPEKHNKKPSWLSRMGNRLLVLFQLTCGFALASMALSRDVYRDISDQIYTEPSPILNSYFLDLFFYYGSYNSIGPAFACQSGQRIHY